MNMNMKILLALLARLISQVAIIASGFSSTLEAWCSSSSQMKGKLLCASCQAMYKEHKMTA